MSGVHCGARTVRNVEIVSASSNLHATAVNIKSFFSDCGSVPVPPPELKDLRYASDNITKLDEERLEQV
jgi:hypothetical protein